MAQLNTAPEINPTILDKLPNQLMLVKSPALETTFILDDVKKEQDTKTFTIPQMDYVKLSFKNRVVANVPWNLTSVNLISQIPVDLAFVQSLLPIGRDFNSFVNFNTVRFSIKPTSTANMQGLMLVGWNNSAADSLVKGRTPPINIAYMWQLPNKFFISPNTSDEYNFDIPLNFPFNFFKWGVNSPGFSGSNHRYMNQYRFGILYFYVVVPLATKTSLTGLNYSVSAQLVDTQISGLKFN